MKKLLIIVLLLTAVGLSARSKAEFSLVVRPLENTVKIGSPVNVEVKTVNLTNHDLAIANGSYPNIYTYDVRREGTLVAETELAKKLKQPRPPCKQPGTASCVEITDSVVGIEPLPPHQTRTETIPVSDYRDMSQPGTYTLQLQEVDSILSGGKVHEREANSNIVTVTVEP
jgi:hypothetical protein